MAIDYKARYLALKAQMVSLQAELDQALVRKVGIRSDGTVDRYTEMPAAALRDLVIRRGGDPDEIVEGLHSRQRAIRMREWLRANPAKRKAEKVETPTPKKRKPKAEAEPAPAPKKRGPKAKAEEPAPTGKKKTRKL